MVRRTKEQLEYIESRNSLIPFAERAANKKTNPLDFKNEDDFKAAWNLEFHQNMNRLWENRVKRGRA